MPSTVHEVLVQAVRAAPELVRALLVSAGYVERARQVDAGAAGEAGEAREDRVSLEDAGLPTLVSALTADALVVIRQGDVKLAVVVEVQLESDESKLYTWPSYQAAARYRHRCPALVVVICPSERVAAWAAREVSIDGHRSTFGACVFGPKALGGLDVRNGAPEVKWLVAYALRDDEERGPPAFEEATEALAQLPDEVMMGLYCKTLSDALSPAVRAHYEALEMNQPTAPEAEEDPFVTRVLERVRARRAELAAGRAEGKAEGKAEALLLVLRSRGLDLPEALSERILAERDPTVLDAWLLAAMTATAAADVFGPTAE